MEIGFPSEGVALATRGVIAAAQYDGAPHETAVAQREPLPFAIG